MKKFGEVTIAAIAALFMLTSAIVHKDDGPAENILYILSLQSYPDPRPYFQSTWEDGWDMLPSFYLALDQINNRTDILNDFTLRLIDRDDGCNIITRTVIGFAGSGVLNGSTKIVGIIGPNCVGAAQTIVSLTSRDDFAFISLHFGTDREIFSDREKFPYSFGIIDSLEVYAAGVVHFIRSNMFDRVAILYADNNKEFYAMFRYTEDKLNKLSGHEIVFSDITRETYLPLVTIQELFAPVIVVFAGSEVSRKLLCMAYHERVLYPSYQWLFIDRIISDFESSVDFSYEYKSYHCSKEMLQKAVNGSISFILELITRSNSTLPVLGETYQEFDDKYEKLANISHVTPTEWANPFYDAIWALALALNASLGELAVRNISLTNDYKQSNRPQIAKLISQCLFELDFEGVTGRVKFERDSGFINRTLSIIQFIDGGRKTVGFYRDGILNSQNNDIGGKFDSYNQLVSFPVSMLFLIITIIAIPPAIVVQVISIVKSNYKSIKASSPRINHIAFIGFYFLALTVVLHTVTVAFWLKDSVLNVLCNTIPWFLNIGLSCMLGTVCLKTWRIYHIFFYSSKHNLQHSNYMNKDYFLALVILTLSLVDILVCTLWVALDPYTSNEMRSFEYKEDNPIVVYKKMCYSQSTPYFILILAGHKVLLLLSALFFAILTRRVKWKGFETRNVTILVYLLSVICGLMVPIYIVTFSTQLDINVTYSLLCIVLNMLMYICLFVLFMPPLYPLLREKFKL